LHKLYDGLPADMSCNKSLKSDLHIKIRRGCLIQSFFGDTRRLLSGVGCDPRSFVGADQEADLNGANKNQDSSENSESLGPVGNSFISRFWPYYLIGAVTGAVYVGVVLWFNGYGRNGLAESDQKRHKRDKYEG
jgi:hypothetical protein